jgi:hypothetical protein
MQEIMKAVKLMAAREDETMTVARVTVTLGRDGMGDATEADFYAWVDYVCERIDAACGFVVDVETRSARDVQDDDIRAGGDDAIHETIRNALSDMYEQWCAEG